MERQALEFDDADLARRFTAANAELDADDFVARVVRRSQRRALVRDVVLGVTLAVALVFALGPLGLADALVDYAREWQDPAWYRENALVLGASLAMAAWPLVARWLAR